MANISRTIQQVHCTPKLMKDTNVYRTTVVNGIYVTALVFGKTANESLKNAIIVKNLPDVNELLSECEAFISQPHAHTIAEKHSLLKRIGDFGKLTDF